MGPKINEHSEQLKTSKNKENSREICTFLKMARFFFFLRNFLQLWPASPSPAQPASQLGSQPASSAS